jgi:uncharacterized membrane protein
MTRTTCHTKAARLGICAMHTSVYYSDCLPAPCTYRYVRHPGYLGWFIWAVGTQVLLANPVCTLLFAQLVRDVTWWTRITRRQQCQMHQHLWHSLCRLMTSFGADCAVCDCSVFLLGSP